jgi:Xaa-Pro aminopeptidase
MLLNRDRADELMESADDDALVVAQPRNVYYVSGLRSEYMMSGFWDCVTAAILPRSRQVPPTVVVSNKDFPDLAENPTWMPEVRAYRITSRYATDDEYLERKYAGDGREPTALEREIQRLASATRPTLEDTILDAIGRALKDHGLSGGRLGFDDPRLAAAVRESGGVTGEAVDALVLLRRIRLVKTPDEIALLRQAAAINQRALDDAVAAARRGAARWSDVVRAHKLSLVGQGGSVVGDKSLLFGGQGGPAAHSMVLRNEDFPLEPGQFVTFDCLGAYQGYHCDFARMGTVGRPRPEHSRVHEGVLQGLAAAEAALQPGVGVFEVRRRGVDAIVATGLAEAEMTTCITHGVGLELFELGGSSYAGFPEYTLEENMVVNVDFFYRGLGPDRAPAHVEDSYLITRSGPERLYTMPRVLIEI